MRLIEASNVIAACDRHIGQILAHDYVTDAGFEKIDVLLTVRAIHQDLVPTIAAAEMNQSLYGDGTPGDISHDIHNHVEYGVDLPGGVVEMWKHGFCLGETVNLARARPGYNPGTVIGFAGENVRVRWSNPESGQDVPHHHIRLRHGP